MPRDIPIIFSAPMIQALLAGRKTQTRRIITKPAALDALGVFGSSFLLKPGNVDLIRYAVGDRLWVRECWSDQDCCEGEAMYRASAHDDGLLPEEVAETRWRPSIHMPRWASRLTLVVEDVRVQRLHDISGYDAVWEGIFLPGGHPRGYGKPALFPGDEGLGEQCEESDKAFVTLYESLWNSINGPSAWDANPFVVALTFSVHCCNIDRLAATLPAMEARS
ncbi:hypothetical protein ABNQ39_11215 [Azospirillum sp. A26]|uniref:hypothetical protein n=1 Tax=Azospirillum sp. A26 TaxID=3160607 RepID=UPI003672EF9C